MSQYVRNGNDARYFLEDVLAGFHIGKSRALINGNFRILNWRYVNVPYVWPYELWGYSLKSRPYFSAIYMVGSSNLGSHPKEKQGRDDGMGCSPS